MKLAARALPVTGQEPNLGTGQVAGNSFNNAGFLALFAILAAAMVMAAIYFFFIAKNGGFKKITKNDWDDYKSTVLRRKGPDGKTLSNATKSTKLGGGSVVPKWAKSEYTRSSESSYGDRDMREVEEGRRHERRETRHTSRHDPELAAYKTEKAAKVGGLNTSMHGSQWDYSNTDRSDVTPAPVSKKDVKKAEKERKAREKAEQKEAARLEKEQKKQQKEADKRSKYAPSEAETTTTAPQQQPRRGQPSAAYSFQQGDDAESSVYTATERRTEHTNPSSIRQVSYYESYRPHNNQLPPVHEQPTPASSDHSNPNRHSGQRSNRASRESMNRQGSPRKQHRASAPRSDYTATTDTGTKVYEHHIPGVSKNEMGPEDSISQVGGRRRYQEQYRSSHAQPPASASSGYRRGRGRGDSLSEGEM
jgi:hypothetical protein